MNILTESIDWFKHLFRDYIPFTNPVLVLSLVLLIILFSPLIFKKFNIPGIIGLILAGVIIGPNTLHLIDKSTSFELFSKTGLLYIMFLAGLEIDMQEYKQNRNKSIVFGALTFFVPITIGYIVCVYVFHMPLLAALLLASIFSTHTLLSYPIVSQMGVVKNRAVQITFGGTIITDTAVLILLGIIANLFQGKLTSTYWMQMLFSLAALGGFTLFLLPKISRWVFRNIEGQGSSQYIYVLAVVFLSAFASELAGVEPIIGAFLAGLALNRVVPHNSVLMNRIGFIGNTLFIPFFLISSGMLVDLRVFFQGSAGILFAVIVCAVAISTKYLAAYLTGKIFNYTKNESNIIFGLSTSHAAATLSVVAVGAKLGMFDQTTINGTIIMILITCMLSSFVTEAAARKIAIADKDSDADVKVQSRPERILIPMANPENMTRLVDFALMIKNPKSVEPLYPLSIVEDDSEADSKLHMVKKTLEGIVDQVESVEKKVQILKKVDLNIVDGIVRTAKAYAITEIIVNWHSQQGTSNFIFGTIADNIVAKSEQRIFITKILQPLNSYNKAVVVMTPNAELELNFKRSCFKINRILKNVGDSSILYGTEKTLSSFQAIINDKKGDFYKYQSIDSTEDLSFIDNDYSNENLYIILSSRSQTISYDHNIENFSKNLSKTYEFSSFTVIYPEIADHEISQLSDFASVTVPENIIRMKDKITGLFKKEETDN